MNVSSKVMVLHIKIYLELSSSVLPQWYLVQPYLHILYHLANCIPPPHISMSLRHPHVRHSTQSCIHVAHRCQHIWKCTLILCLSIHFNCCINENNLTHKLFSDRGILTLSDLCRSTSIPASQHFWTISSTQTYNCWMNGSSRNIRSPRQFYNPGWAWTHLLHS